MSFLSFPPNQARKPFAEVLPDGRKRITCWFKPTTTGEFPQELVGAAYAVGQSYPFTPAPTGWDGLRLTYKEMDDASRGFPDGGKDATPLIKVTWEQISATAETQVGNPTVVVNQYGYQEVTYNWVQFSINSPTFQVPGTTTAPAPYSSWVLRDQEAPDDGTLRQIKRTYVQGGELSDTSELRFGGKLTIRTLKYLNVVPPTPSGYTLVGPGVEYINGLPVYSYQFAKASAADGTGTGAVISQAFTDNQNGTVAFNAASPNTATGVVICTTQYVSTLAITTNPVTQPTSFVLFSVDYEDESGFRMWTTRSGYGDGLVVDETLIQQATALVVYHRISFGSAPSTPSATIGGTVTLFESSVENENGTKKYDYRWAEGDGQSSITTEAHGDGAIDYSVTTLSAAATTPSYPGGGTGYLLRLTQDQEDAYFRNMAVYRKAPPTTAYRKTMGYQMPGLAYLSGTNLVLSPPVNMQILVTATVSYSTTQTTTTPWSITAPASFYDSYVPYLNPGTSPSPGTPPTDTSTAAPQASQRGLGGYVAGASSGGSSNDFYNGTFCQTYAYTLVNSTPSSRPSGATTISVDNDDYLTDTSGTKVFRITVVTYSF